MMTLQLHVQHARFIPDCVKCVPLFLFVLYYGCSTCHHPRWTTINAIAEAFTVATISYRSIHPPQPSTIHSQTSRHTSIPSIFAKSSSRRVIDPSLHATVTSSRRSSIMENNYTTTTIWSKQRIVEYANQQGVIISLSTLGPAYRAIARAKHNTTQIMGYIEGFIRPGQSILHLDKMEVFAKMIDKARKENPSEFKGGGTILGLGLLLGYLCLLHGTEQGCTIAEFLAIDDNEKQHQRLVKFYKISGFQYVKYVGDDWQSIPDRLVWGGCGTLLRNDIDTLLQFWTHLLEKSTSTKQ
jgi:hypothetical protein